jgi:hypothetical protein
MITNVQFALRDAKKKAGKKWVTMSRCAKDALTSKELDKYIVGYKK